MLSMQPNQLVQSGLPCDDIRRFLPENNISAVERHLVVAFIDFHGGGCSTDHSFEPAAITVSIPLVSLLRFLASRSRIMEPGQLPDVTPGRSVTARRSLRRMLYSQNPFYLLSVCFVLHGTGIWYRANSQTHSPWILTGIISAYIVMMAGVGFSIVKWGKVWDDARSILLILLALFLELGMTADDVMIGDRATGRAMALVAWLVSVCVSEFILVGLGIRLKLLYRVPFHLLLGLILLYPIAIVQGDYPHNVEQNCWSIFLFSPIAAGILLTLVPAIRRGARYVKDNGTPWLWPLFPWSLFVFLITVVLFRSYALCLSFDPVLDVSWNAALELENSFGGIYFVPIILAVSVLCLEGFLSTGNHSVRRAGLLLPFSAIYLAWPGINDSTLYLQFVDQFTEQLAAPVWLATMLAIVLLTYAMLRRIRSSEIALSASLVLFAFLQPAGSGFRSFSDPSQIPLILAASMQVWAGWRQKASVKVFAGLLCCIVVIRSLIPTSDVLTRDIVSWYLSLAAVLFVGLTMKDWFADFLRQLAGLMLTATCLAPPILVWMNLLDIGSFHAAGHMIGATVASFVLSWMTQGQPFRTVAVVNSSAITLAGSLKLIQFLIRLPGGKGILWALGGLLWLVMAAVISARKAGVPLPIPGPPQNDATKPTRHE